MRPLLSFFFVNWLYTQTIKLGEGRIIGKVKLSGKYRANLFDCMLAFDGNYVE